MASSDVLVHWGDIDKFPENANGSIAFLDRDGVINIGRPDYVKNLDELSVFDGVKESIERISERGYYVCVVTNQSQVNRGIMSEADLVKIHSFLLSELRINLILSCTHSPKERCRCRKPSPAMLRLGNELLNRSNEKNNLQTERVVIPKEMAEVDWWSAEKPVSGNRLDFMVGDRLSDLGAGWAYGARLFQTNNHTGLTEVVEDILSEGPGVDFNPVGR